MLSNIALKPPKNARRSVFAAFRAHRIINTARVILAPYLCIASFFGGFSQFYRLTAAGMTWLTFAILTFFVFVPRSVLAAACVNTTKLPGVASECKTQSPPPAPKPDEMDISQTTVYDEFKTNCSGSCFIKKGSELCAAISKLKVPSAKGAYGCFKSSDCEENTVLVQGEGSLGETCLGGTVCCFAKTSAKAPAKPAAKPGAPVTLPDPLSGLNFPKLLGNVIRTFAGIAGAIALLMFVYGGVMWILSGGVSDKVKNAQKILINAAIGLILIFGAYTFVSSIVNFIIEPPPGTVGGGETAEETSPGGGGQ